MLAFRGGYGVIPLLDRMLPRWTASDCPPEADHNNRFADLRALANTIIGVQIDFFVFDRPPYTAGPTRPAFALP